MRTRATQLWSSRWFLRVLVRVCLLLGLHSCFRFIFTLSHPLGRMMASSPRAVLTGQRKITARVVVIIITIILLDLSISVESSIFGVRESLTARVRDTVNIPFKYCGLPIPSCTLTQSFNLSSPNPTCTVDRYGHCEVTPAPVDDPIRHELSIGCELCVLVIHGVTQKDAGRYAICQTSGACTSSFWSTISTLKVVSGNEEPSMPTSMTTKVSTKPTTEKRETASLTTEAVELIPMLFTKFTERVGNDDAHINEKPEHPGECYSRQDIILTAFGVFIAVIALVAVIWTIRRVRKRRQRSKFDDHECYLPGLPMGPSQPVIDNGYAVPGDSDDDVTGKTRS